MSGQQQIDLAAAQAGMTLAQDVTNDSGQILATAGTSLTPNLIEGLRKRGIEYLSIREQVDATVQAAQRDERIAYLFRNAAGDDLRASLRRALEQYRRMKDAAC